MGTQNRRGALTRVSKQWMPRYMPVNVTYSTTGLESEIPGVSVNKLS